MTEEEIIEAIEYKRKTLFVATYNKQGFTSPPQNYPSISLSIENAPCLLDNFFSYKADSFEIAVFVVSHFMSKCNDEIVDTTKFTCDRNKDIYVWLKIVKI